MLPRSTSTFLCSPNSAAATPSRSGSPPGERAGRQDEQYLDLVGKPGWPKAKLQKKLASIELERAEIRSQLADVGSNLDTGGQFFLTALDLLRDPQAFYPRACGAMKHALTKAIFTKLYLDVQEVLWSGHDLAEGPGTNRAG